MIAQQDRRELSKPVKLYEQFSRESNLKIVVNISDARVSNDPVDELITYSLGSCIGVAVYDPVKQVGGLLHYQLPNAGGDPKQVKNPLMYADTGLKYLIDKMLSLGVNKKQLKVKIAGGAQIMNDAKTFQIGKRNYAAVRQILWKNGIFIDAEDVGGKYARNLSLRIADGFVEVKSQGQTKQL
ncbi:MAG: chemotaxis protein CheD [Sedimentisphaerales bacterium]|nr:chemotaxis protein CheD [Sedimentisphaerales bacterium]